MYFLRCFTLFPPREQYARTFSKFGFSLQRRSWAVQGCRLLYGLPQYLQAYIVSPSGFEPESPAWEAGELNLLFEGDKWIKQLNGDTNIASFEHLVAAFTKSRVLTARRWGLFYGGASATPPLYTSAGNSLRITDITVGNDTGRGVLFFYVSRFPSYTYFRVGNRRLYAPFLLTVSSKNFTHTSLPSIFEGSFAHSIRCSLDNPEPTPTRAPL